MQSNYIGKPKFEENLFEPVNLGKYQSPNILTQSSIQG